MSELPVLDRVLKVGGLYTQGEEMVVQFTDLPQQCSLSTKAPDFAKSVASLAESWRLHQTVHVKMRGAGEIVSVSGP